VLKGEYLSQIARLYETDWRTLAEINDLENPSLIYAGEKLCVATTGTIIPNTGSNSSDVPTIEILGAVRNEEVTILAYEFPANTRIEVLMDEMGTNAEDGYLADTVYSNRNGVIQGTFDIPKQLRGDRLIAIRLEAPSTGHYSYNWFSNTTFETERGGAYLDDESAVVGTARLSFGESADVYQGRAGLFTPSSNYTGEAVLTRYKLDSGIYQHGLDFTQDLLDVQVLDSQGDPFTKVYGLNYVYFNLNNSTRRAYDRGDLDIYYYNPDAKAWSACDVQVLIDTKNHPNGRLACIIEDFGLYGMAIR
jgi:LysM repeat protein